MDYQEYNIEKATRELIKKYVPREIGTGTRRWDQLTTRQICHEANVSLHWLRPWMRDFEGTDPGVRKVQRVHDALVQHHTRIQAIKEDVRKNRA